MEHDVASGQMYAYTEIPTTSPPGYRRERLIIPLGLWSFPVDEKPIFPFFVDWALQGGASKPRPSNFLSTGIVDWAGWYLVLSTGLAGSYSQCPAPHVPKKTWPTVSGTYCNEFKCGLAGTYKTVTMWQFARATSAGITVPRPTKG